MTHDSHDISYVSGYCILCGIGEHDPLAALRCVPSTDDSGLPSDVEPAEREIDYMAITRSLAT